MKNLTFLIMAFYFITTTANAQQKTVSVKNAKITWQGHKVVGSHEGTINLNNGAILLQGDDLKGGTFVVDMTSINTTDIEGESKKKLDAHLKNEDFFNVNKYPKSTLKLTKIKKMSSGKYDVEGDLTIKDITKPIQFTLYLKNGKGHANLEIDRTLYGIQYNSDSFFTDLGNSVISDIFNLGINFAY